MSEANYSSFFGIMPIVIGLAAIMSYYILTKRGKLKTKTIEPEHGEGDSVQIVLNVPKQIVVNIDAEELLDYIVSKRKKQPKESEEAEEENEGEMSAELMLQKGLVKEG